MKKRILMGGAAVLALAAALFAWSRRGGEAAPSWRVAQVTRGDLRSSVSATGTLQARVTVEVGTQVSGIVSAVHVDFNDRVTAGQVIARIDETLLRNDLEAARARLAQSTAERDHSRSELARIRGLHERQAATDLELETARYGEAAAVAAARAAEVSVERARRNLTYATIVAPIAGTVVDRSVEPGQTVNAGFSAPRLFTLAGDLARMQIIARVDEADISRIQVGQAVDFTVQAWPDETFVGTVRQVRLQSALQENVVTYAAVVDVDNPKGRLLPGMTATVDFVLERVRDVLSVPAAALRFRGDTPAADRPTGPAPGGVATNGARAEGGGRNGGGGRPGAGGGSRRGGPGGGAAGGGADESQGTVYIVAPSGALQAVPLTLGVRTEDRVEVRGGALQEGAEVVLGSRGGTPSGSPSSPFQSSQPQGQRPPGGF